MIAEMMIAGVEKQLPRIFESEEHDDVAAKDERAQCKIGLIARIRSRFVRSNGGRRLERASQVSVVARARQ